MSLLKEPLLCLFALLVFTEISNRPTQQTSDTINCDPGLRPMPLELEECSSDNCLGKCTKAKNPAGLVFDICCVDLRRYTCYNESSLVDLRDACFNTSTENDSSCESFEQNVQCASEFFNVSMNVCYREYVDLFKMKIINRDSDSFEPINCPCNTSYTKTNIKCPCTEDTDECGVNMGHEDICCFKTSYLKEESPCSTSEITASFGTCTNSTCRGRCTNTTGSGEHVLKVCCIGQENLEDDETPQPPTEKSTPGGAIAGSIIGALIAVAAIGVIIYIYLRSKGQCVSKAKKPNRENEAIKMQTRENGSFSDILKENTDKD